MRLLIVIFILIFSFGVNAQKVSFQEAQLVAENWSAMKMGRVGKNSLANEESKLATNHAFYIFNLDDDGFVLVSGDKNTCPILAYSNTGKVDLDNLPVEFQSWLDYYSEMILFNAKQKGGELGLARMWEELKQGASLKSTQISVPSLFQSTGSSNWAAWNYYFSQAPETPPQYRRGYNGCVPGRIAELMKYHKHPRIGNGGHSYSYDGVTITEEFNKIFEYEEMPYQLTYCGNGHPTCNDGSFDIIPGTTQKNIDQIGWLQYLAGISVEMRWLGYRGHPDTVSTGTFDTNTGDWAGSMASYFNFSPNYDYWPNWRIRLNTNVFKVKARENLMAGIPILFRYETVLYGGGHAVIIDGVENDDFFHIIFGWGGFMDGYYYLFSSDSDGSYEPRPHIDKWGLNATFDIVPNCPTVDDISFSSQTVNVQEGFVFEAKENVTLSNVTIAGNGQDGGRAVAKAANSVTISSDFEVQLGAQFSIYVEPCGN